MFFFYFEDFEKEIINILEERLGTSNVTSEVFIPGTHLRADAIIHDASMILNTQKQVIVETAAKLTSVKINHVITLAHRIPEYDYLIVYNSHPQIDDSSKSLQDPELSAPPQSSIKVNNVTIHFLSDEEIKVKLPVNNHRRRNSIKATPISQTLKRARAAYKSQNTTIFLGAGISIDAGLPSWKDFLKNIMNSLKDAEKEYELTGNDYEDILHQCHDSSLIVGQYLKEYSTRRSIQDIAKASLYKDYHEQDHKIIDAIIEVIKSHPPKSIITYNYDDLIESNLDNALGEIMPRTVSGGQIIPEGVLPIYHVHGYIPRGEKFIEDIILTEESYHKIYQEPFHWSNIVQLNAMNHTTCFLIGFSMSDPNLRRLLDISMKNCTQDNDNNNPEPRHFIFLQRQKLKPNCPECHKNHTNEEINERIFKRLGLDVIWFDKFDELPAMIRKLG